METQMDKVSYIIGRQIGGDFKTQGINVNADIFMSAFNSAILGEESKISMEDTQIVMNEFQTQMQAAAMEKANEAGGENLELGNAYLEENKTKEGVEVTASGLQYKVLTAGEGATPTAESSVEVHYEGTLIDGTVFDSSYKRGETTSFPVAGVIAGWTEALQLMKEGSVYELTIPAALAYGSQGAGAQIGPNSTLNFKVELVKVL
jgi:FKBP-type peptidyl-prolyl cis-trans isomerase FklB